MNYLLENIYSTSSYQMVEKKMMLLGKNKKQEILKFLNFRLLSSIIILFMLLYFFEWGYLLTIFLPVIVIGYYMLLPVFYFDLRINLRKRKLEYEAIYFFEVFALALESGNNLINGLAITSKNVESELSSEIKKMLNEISLGKGYVEAIDYLKLRIPSDAINNILINIKEGIMFGNNILNNLDSQINYLQESRIMRLKGNISKIPLKISVISVIFFIPLLLLLILGPVLISYIS